MCVFRCSLAPASSAKGAAKPHTMLDLRGNFPAIVHIDDSTSCDTDILDVMAPEPGAIYVMDRGHLALFRLQRLSLTGASFVVRRTVLITSP